MTRVLVTGSRGWTDRATVRNALLEAVAGQLGSHTLIHGAAAGADRIAEAVAVDLGWHVIPFPVTPEQWRWGGAAAAKMRNQQMVDTHPDVCLAFLLPCRDKRCQRVGPHDTHGTAHCAQLAEKAGIRVRRYT